MMETDAAARYARCEALVLSLDGGYVAHERDPGGPTNTGVTRAALSAWRGHPCTANDIRALGNAEALGQLQQSRRLAHERARNLAAGPRLRPPHA